MSPLLANLLEQQCGVATLEQLIGAGLTAHQVRADVDARRWTRYGDRCVLTHNATPTRRQWMWLALLDNHGATALCGFSALEVRGFRFFGAELELIHVVVPRGAVYHRFPGVHVHESRRFRPEDVERVDALPVLGAARSALDAAAWQPHRRYACAVLAAVVQQRLCTADDLTRELPRVGRIRHKAVMRLTVLDVSGGAEALSELDVGRMCRRFGICPPSRQGVRRDRQGRKRYLDCEWTLVDGRVVVLEVDGSHHLLVEHWEADVRRERGVVTSGRSVLRATANEVRHEPEAVVADLIAIGIPRL